MGGWDGEQRRHEATPTFTSGNSSYTTAAPYNAPWSQTTTTRDATVSQLISLA